MIFYLDEYGQDCKCPYCGAEFGMEWNTEYGGPHPDTYDVRCPNCSNIMQVKVETITRYTVTDRSESTK